MEMEKTTDEENRKKLEQYVHANLYKIRDCHFYKLEYKECKSLRGRFHQYFVYGDYLDCSQWKEDFDNCEKSQKNMDDHLESLATIINHENKRLKKRLENHFANDVWKKRDEPPSFWNKELPDWIKKRNKDSFVGSEDSED